MTILRYCFEVAKFILKLEVEKGFFLVNLFVSFPFCVLVCELQIILLCFHDYDNSDGNNINSNDMNTQKRLITVQQVMKINQTMM